MKKTYSEKLRDPRWQKKRLEIMSRDSFKCRFCGDSENTLHVHHLKYSRGKEPWDYPDISLITLCEHCHEADHSWREDAETLLIEALKICGFSASDLENLRMIAVQNDHETKINKLIDNISLLCYKGSPYIAELNAYAEALFKRANSG